MRIRHFAPLRALALAAALLLPALSHAQLFRAYLASNGADSSPCTLLAPCRLLPAALAAVADGGEIWMLDSANYNTSQVNITKSVTILAIPGALGSVVGTGGGDAINIATPGAVVTLRNLSVAPIAAGAAANGIVMNSGARLTVENSVIYNFAQGAGIRVTAAATVRVVDTVLRDNSFGVWLQGGATGDVASSRMMGNSNFGIRVTGNNAAVTQATVTGCLITGNFYGVSAYSDNASASAMVNVIRSTVSHNSTAVRADSFQGGAFAVVSESLVAGNGVAFSQVGAGSLLETMGNNTVRRNVSADEGTITTTATR